MAYANESSKAVDGSMSDDLIRRSDAIKALYKYSFVSKDVIEREIKAIPSADRPRGEWIKDNLGTVICSECKRPRRDNRVNHINFCNSCGARMKGADDGTDRD